MQRSSTFLVLLLIHFISSVGCIPQEVADEDGIPSLDGDEFPLLYDDSDLGFQSFLDPTPNLISAEAGDHCSTFDISPNEKVRARGAVCSDEQQAPSTALDIPDLDIYHNTEYLCPFDMKLGLRVLVCGKPVSIEGLTPDVVTTVEDARLCKFTRLLKRDFNSRACQLFPPHEILNLCYN